MLYCLTRDVYNDLVAMKHHDHFHYDGTNCQFLDILPKECRMVSTLSLITAAAKKIHNDQKWQHATMVVRNWVTTVYPFNANTTDMNFVHYDSDDGYWEYTYAACGATKLFISKHMYSSHISVIGGVPYYKVDNGLLEGEYTIEEIANSNQRFKLDAVFPAEPRMFAEDNVEYMIPYNLIN